MSYREDERKRVIKIRDEIFKDPGGGIYKNKEREFVLQDPMLNLFTGIREDALGYFADNQIVWWGDQNNQPSGHLLSSQIACLNHLYFLRQNKAAATAIIKAVLPDIVEAEMVDDGFVEFEAVGRLNYLGERSHTRGANATSIDAIMVGKRSDGKNILVMIEWKYTESYTRNNKYIPARARVYDRLLADPHCPIRIEHFANLYYEPFYQLMRQTLLGWKMVEDNEYNCDQYHHLHIIPSRNEELKIPVTSPELVGESMSEAWKNVLFEPERYQVISPVEFLAPLKDSKKDSEAFDYLSRRYWS